MTGALFNDSRTRRYLLWRRWDYSGPRVTWICLNPSTAGEKANDHSVTKMIGFAKRWGYSAIDVVNLFDIRSTKPAVLYGAKLNKLTSPKNDLQIVKSCRQSKIIICAWGGHGSLHGRDETVIKMLLSSAVTRYKIHVLKFNADGTPAHPLMMPYSLVPAYSNYWKGGK
jgi:hypothetical protein